VYGCGSYLFIYLLIFLSIRDFKRIFIILPLMANY